MKKFLNALSLTFTTISALFLIYCMGCFLDISIHNTQAGYDYGDYNIFVNFFQVLENEKDVVNLNDIKDVYVTDE